MNIQEIIKFWSVVLLLGTFVFILDFEPQMNMQEIMKFWAVILLLGSFVFMLKYKTKTNRVKIMQNGSFTAGCVTGYFYGGFKGSAPGFHYKYSDAK